MATTASTERVAHSNPLWQEHACLHQDLPGQVAKGYCRGRPDRQEEVESALLVELVKLCQNYDAQRCGKGSKLGAYLVQRLRWYACNELKRIRLQMEREEKSLEYEVSWGGGGEGGGEAAHEEMVQQRELTPDVVAILKEEERGGKLALMWQSEVMVNPRLRQAARVCDADTKRAKVLEEQMAAVVTQVSLTLSAEEKAMRRNMTCDVT